MITDRSFMLDDLSPKFIKTCSCPDEEVSHLFSLKALAFDNEKGIALTVKVYISLDLIF